MSAGSSDSRLDLLAAVARQLTGGEPPESTLRQVLALLRSGSGATGVALWFREPAALTWRRLSDPAAPESEPEGAASPAPSSDWTMRLPLIHEGESLGLLEVSPPLSPQWRDVFGTVADMVSPWLGHLEHSGDLAAEVAFRARQVEEQRRFTSLVIDSLPVGVYVVDRDYRIQLWNRKRETGTQGLLKDDVLGRPVFEVLTRQPARELRAEFDEVFTCGEERQIELEVTNQEERLAYRIRKIPMRLGDNGVSHVITIGEDVTHWRAVQQQIVQSEKLAAVGQLTAGIMHEINNPLATIGACVVAMEGRLPEIPPGAREVLADYLQIVEKEVERCTTILDGLLDFSRPQSRNKAPVDLNSLMEDALFLVQHHPGFRRLQVVRELDADLPMIEGSGGQILQVLLAILLNAMDAMPEGGTLTAGTALAGIRTVAEIRDTGQGIARADLPKIFEPFFTTKDPGKGTGLGLAVCYGIVREHGGTIEVESDPGRGSLFRISLPVQPQERQQF